MVNIIKKVVANVVDDFIIKIVDVNLITVKIAINIKENFIVGFVKIKMNLELTIIRNEIES